ncbi:MAG TPA: pirin family protein [Actinophytocola sp.]|uniref:pirin family protein n=1 Tax=Actinophytocola sp. TaxID=1872138 RepID=UPI002F942370
MSNLDTRPEETVCRTAADDHAVALLLEPRDVPLGGLRGIHVDRLLPQRGLPTVGAWCFLDIFGPNNTQMSVLPHPHTGLQTVTWPLAGEIHHRDSVGSDVLVRPGQLNLMTGGRGVAHSEISAGGGELLHGLQLWVALPAERDDMAPAFEQHVDLPVFARGGVRATVFVGELAGERSPATVYTPLVGADLTVDAGSRATIPLRPDFEHAIVAVDRTLVVSGVEVPPARLLYLGTGREDIMLSAGRQPVRAVLLGGEPFADELVMWWNFVGRSHDEIAAAREDWETPGQTRFGVVHGHGGARIPAPELPRIRLTPRRHGHRT